MKYRFIVIGDLHLTSGPQNADRLAALDYVIADQDGQRVDAWLWPGDLTDAGMTIAIRNDLVERVRTMAAVAPVVIVPGNHDPAGDLDFLAKIKTIHDVHVVTSPQVIEVELRCKDQFLLLFCLPYPNKARIVAAGTPPDKVGDVASQAFDGVFLEAGAHLTDARQTRCVLTGMIGHVTVSGAVASTGQPQIGNELSINALHLSRLGDCFKVCNHIHKHQRVHGVVYAGSLCRMDFGETEPKGYVVVECEWIEETLAPVRLGSIDVDPSAQQLADRLVPLLFVHPRVARWTHREAFMPVPVPAMYHVEGTLTREAFAWRVTKGAGGAPDSKMTAADMAGSDVRVRVSYSAAEREVLGDMKARIDKEFSGARKLVIETIAVQDRALRSAEVVQAKTLDDKLQAWARCAGVAWSEQIGRCVDRLQSSRDADSVVADVEARLSRFAEAIATNERIEALTE